MVGITGKINEGLDKLATKRWQKRQMAEKLKAVRTDKGLTQKELAHRVGVSESAIRNYELMAALPKEKHLIAIAKALDIRPEALKLYDIGYQTLAINALFQLGDVYGLEPHSCTDYAFLSPTSDFMKEMLEKWTYHYDGCLDGKISREEYDLWLDTFNGDFNPADFPKRYREAEGSYELIEPWEPWCLAQKLKRLRKQQGLTQAELAKLIGVTEPAIRSYEQAKRLPKESVIEALAAALEVTKESLTFFDFGSPNQAAHALFQISRTFGLRPDAVDGGAMLRTCKPGLERAIDKWADAFGQYEESEDQNRYFLWQDTYDDDRSRGDYQSRYRYVVTNGQITGDMESDYDLSNSDYPLVFRK